ncbi:hypothetical protein MKW94_011108 [Papaver nudicaule]|uniref:Amino acid transporter transmembrane domain-containing protein n=1 Tax=Papaver nudicaule TaxID=74823 RepID=A0AA41VBV5_PAPNU|nr:hypothetical protein [Papaver nudicaule]
MSENALRIPFLESESFHKNYDDDDENYLKSSFFEQQADSSFLHSVINMSGVLIGLGQLATPYAIQNGGWASAFLLIGFGMLGAYTSCVLAECLKYNLESKNYFDIGYHAFGKKGRIIASTFIYLDIFMGLVSYTISLNDNLSTVFAGINLNVSWTSLSTTQFLTVSAVAIALPTLWLRDLSKISFLSTMGIILSLMIFITVGCTAVFGGVKANQAIPVLQLENIPAVSGLYIFGFASHMVFPDIYKSMKDPSKFTKVSVVSFGLVTILYTALGVMGAKLFGPNVSSQVTLSMPEHLIFTKIALWATVLTPMTKYAFELLPIASQIEHKLHPSMNSKARMFIRGAVGSLLLIFVLVLALTVPYFERVLSLTGSLVSTGVAIIFPCAFYIKIFWSELSKPVLVLNFIFIAVGVFFGVFVMNISDVCSDENNTNRDVHVRVEKKLMVLIDNGDVLGHHRDAAASKEGVETNSSFLHSVINMSAILIGLGQLSTPYALQKGGWASSFLLIGFGISCAYTSHLLGKCLTKNEKIRNYADIGNHAFGAKGKFVASTFIYMEVFMALVSFTIALNDNLATVFNGKHLNISWTHLSTSQFLTVAAVIVALPTVWLKDLSKISFLSIVGIVLSFLIFSSVIYIAAFGGVKANRSIPVLQLHNIPAISGLYVFSFSTHVVFPDIYRSMKDPSKFTKVSVLSFTIVTIFYTTIAFVGAKLFGSEVNSQVTLNMPKHLIMTKIALWATVLAPLTKYAFALVPIASQYDRKLPSSVSSRTRLFIRGTIGSMLLIFVLILALAIPHFEQVLGLTGSLVSISVAIIFPCAFYTKMFWSKISNPALVLNATLIVIASILGVLGTISSSKSLVNVVSRSQLS